MNNTDVISSNNAISKLWNSGSEADWLKALKHYDEMIDIRSIEAQELEIYINTIKSNDIKGLPVAEFYDFLYDKYFVWKFTQKNYLANARKYLHRYISGDKLSELADIQRKLFNADLSNIDECLTIATEIRGLATAGASGLLAVLFPNHFGTVDQFVVKVLRDIENIKNKDELQKINPNSISVKGGVTLIKIFREKAEALNKEFNTDFWTPRKIDMVLWAYGR